MARKPRIEYEGAFYHVITRGNQRQTVFHDRQDFQKYLQLLAHYKSRYPHFLYAYALMNNHIHLLIETQSTPLSKILQGISQTYTLYFNKKYHTVGHLFQGRYKAILCDRERYFLALIRYIHHNPVRTGIVHAPEAYPWTSHQYYLKTTNTETLIDTGRSLSMFSDNKTQAQKSYLEFMQDTSLSAMELVDDLSSENYKTVEHLILGNEAFVENVKKRYDGVLKHKQREKEHSLVNIMSAIERIHGVQREQLFSHSKSSAMMQLTKLFCLVAKTYAYKGIEIAGFLGKDPAVVSKHLRDYENLTDDVKKIVTVLKCESPGYGNEAIFNFQA